MALYTDEGALEFFLEISRQYQDRGMMKWNGFYLSDHTAVMEKDGKKRSKINLPKEELTSAEIDNRIQKAYTQFRRVAIQLADLDPENHYYDDLIGKIAGQGEQGIYLQLEETVLLIDVASIRNIEILGTDKILDKEVLR